MNEETREKSEGYDEVTANLAKLGAVMRDYVIRGT